MGLWCHSTCICMCIQRRINLLRKSTEDAGRDKRSCLGILGVQWNPRPPYHRTQFRQLKREGAAGAKELPIRMIGWMDQIACLATCTTYFYLDVVCYHLSASTCQREANDPSFKMPSMTSDPTHPHKMCMTNEGDRSSSPSSCGLGGWGCCSTTKRHFFTRRDWVMGCSNWVCRVAAR